MMQLESLKRSRSLLLKLVTAVGLLTLVIAGLLVYSFAERNALESQLKTIREAARDIIYYDEVLTMSARMFTYTNNEHWGQRYDAAAASLSEVLNKARGLDPLIAQAIDNTSESNDKLIAIETKAFQYARQGKNQKAASILLDAVYERLKEDYSEGVEQALTLLRTETEEHLLRGQQNRATFFMVLALFLATSFVLLLIFLLRYNKHIDNSFETLYSSLRDNHNQLRQKTTALKTATEAKNRFLANLAHEIRTPLNGVMGNLQLLITMDLSDKAQQVVETSLSSSKRFSRLFADLLDFSDMEAGSLYLKNNAFELSDIIDEIASTYRKQCNEKGIQFIVQNEHDRDGWQGDPDRIQQILTQLIDNAVKFTDVGTITLHVGFTDDRQVQFRIIDTGHGMNCQQLDNLFTPFEQGDNSSTRQYGGTGIGMAYVKSLVDLMHGTIQVTSEPGKGTRIQVCLPLNKVEQAQSKKILEKGEKLPAETTVLVAEDNKINQLIVEQMLTDAGARVLMVENGIEAIAAINRSYQIVLMDIQMPEMDGIKACERFKLQKPEIPVIALTANALKDDMALYEKTGFDEVLTKPVDKAELISTLNHHLEKSTTLLF